MLSVQDSRIIIKSSTVTTAVPTVAPSNDHTDGSWSVNDVYKGEMYINLVDDKIFTRTNSGIIELFSTGSAPTLAQVLVAGKTTGGNDIIISDTDIIKSADSNIKMDFGSGDYFWITSDAGAGNDYNLYIEKNNVYASFGNLTQAISFDATQALLLHDVKFTVNSPIIEIGDANIIQSENGDVTMDFGSGTYWQLQFLGGGDIYTDASTTYIKYNLNSFSANAADVTAQSDTKIILSAPVVDIGAAMGVLGKTSWKNTTNTNSVVIQSGVTSASYDLTLPTAQGGANTYLKNDGSGNLSWDAGGGGSTNFDDSVFYIYDNGDNTKKLAFQVSGISAGTTRTLTAPNASGTIALTSDLSAYQPLDADLTSWSAVARASGFDTFVDTPSSANLASLVTDETGSGALVFANTPTLVTPNIGAATGTSLVLSSKINEAQGADIASAATTDIGAATGNYVNVTGTTTITALGTVQAGTRRVVTFTGALTITHNATSLILPDGVDFQTTAGDVLTFISLGSGNWKCTDAPVQYDTWFFGPASAAAPADSTTAYTGVNQVTMNTTSDNKSFVTARPGKIVGISATAFIATTLGSNENVVVALRNHTTATDHSVSTTFQMTAVANSVHINTTISFAANDRFEEKWTYPAFATNPTGVFPSLRVRVRYN